MGSYPKPYLVKLAGSQKRYMDQRYLEGCYLTDCHSSLQSTKSKLKTYPFPYSAAHLMLTVFGRIGVSLQGLVMLTGLGGRLGSTPGLFVGIGLGSWTSFPLTATLTFGGNSSETSLFGSSVRGKKRSCIWRNFFLVNFHSGKRKVLQAIMTKSSFSKPVIVVQRRFNISSTFHCVD
jgi:hypothetical protein